jgi:hypothetical protein
MTPGGPSGARLRALSPRRGDPLRTPRPHFFRRRRPARRRRAFPPGDRRPTAWARGPGGARAADEPGGRGTRATRDRPLAARKAPGGFEFSPDPIDPLDPLDPCGPRHRPRRVARAAPTHRAGARQAHHRRPRLPRSLRFPRGISARQRRGTSDGAHPRSLRDVFGHTASISRRRTS